MFKTKFKKFNLFFFLSLSFLILSCKTEEEKIAVIWSNRVEFASYCELFNSTQDEYKIILEYKDNPAQAIADNEQSSEKKPDIIVGAWLKGSATRTKFANLNSLLSENKIKPENFYSALLKLGNIDDKQVLLPVSFNLPTIIFVRDAVKLENDFIISLDDIKKLSSEYNRLTKNAYVKMGFSPSWDDNFLYITAKGFNAGFEEEGTFFTWNQKSLENTIRYLREWTVEINNSSQAESDFKFKYLYDPPYATLTAGRCLFQHLPGNELLMLPPEKVKNIDFRWLSYNGKTPINDEILYAGIYSKAENKKAAEAFLTWFFTPETQKKLLERTTQQKLKTYGFGLAGGFSSIKPVTENVFPTYYPLLLSHLPQTNSFMPPYILPSNWKKIKKELILPYLRESIKIEKNGNVNNFEALNKTINEWSKNN
ncbi:MAG: hypothetical protein CR988_05145 [Treponema sp.]|nr:MAG: hypothetical protein CR988_05145 [Treponema sp.]